VKRNVFILGTVLTLVSLLSPSLAAAKPPADVKVNETHTETGSIQFGVGDFGGPVVTIVGGGGGPDHSNCTTDETNSSAPLNLGIEIRHFSMVAKAGGSCNTEPSFSFFSVTVVGNSTRGMLNSSGRIWFGQDSAGDPFYVKCVGPFVGMECYNNRGAKGLTIQAVVDKGTLRVTKAVDDSSHLVGPGTTFVVAVSCDRPGYDTTFTFGAAGGTREIPDILAGTQCTVTETGDGDAIGTEYDPGGFSAPTVTIPPNAVANVTVTNIFIPVLGSSRPPAQVPTAVAPPFVTPPQATPPQPVVAAPRFTG
jgi:uncharacterized protein DUF5979